MLDNAVHKQLCKAFEQTSADLQNANLRTSWYMIPKDHGYGTLVDDRLDEIFCLEAYLGPSTVEGYKTYAVAQIFSRAYPSLAITLIIDRHKSDNTLAPHAPVFNPKVDGNFSKIFLPMMFKAFNHLDPHGGKHGILVQLYNAKMSLGDLIHATIYTARLMVRFKKDGQLAIIAVDFNDPLIRFIAQISDPVASLLTPDVHQIPSTDQRSQLHIPLKDGHGGYTAIENSSTALDKGIRLAVTYFNNYFQIN